MPKSPEFRKVIRVFIASPSDLEEERIKFPQIIAEANRIKANPKKIQLEPVGWEDTLPGRGRPQKLINKDIRECSLIVMLLWKRWGSPTGKHTSGFEEEYELAKSLNKRNDEPAIWLYFRSIPDPMLADPGEQLRKVLDFRAKIETEKEFLYRAYESVGQWEGVFREDLCKWLDGLSPTPFRIPSVPPGTSPEGIIQKYEERIKHLEGELKKRATEQFKIANTLAQEAKEKADSGQITKAEEYFAKAAAVSVEPGIINDYGLFLKRIGMLAKAEEKFSQVAQLGKAINEKSIEAVAYGNLGNLYRTRGDLKRAEKMHREALAIEEELGHKEGMANDYGNLGVLYQVRGDLKKAEQMYKKSLAINEELGRKEGMANDYGNLGILYDIRGALKKAEEMHKKSLALNKEIGLKEGMANAYGNLGILYGKRGALKKAEEMHKKSLAIDEEIGRKEGMANAYGNLGNVYQARGNLKKAEQMYKKSLAIEQELGRKQGMADDYYNLCTLYLVRGDLKKAEEMYNKALVIFDSFGNRKQVRKITSLIKEVQILSKKRGND